MAKLAQLSPLAAVAVPGRYGNATGTTAPVTLKERSGLKLRVIAANVYPVCRRLRADEAASR